MTQACDLEHDKVADVVLCPCFPLSAYRLAWAKAEEARNNKPTDKNWASFCNDIKDGYIWNLFILDAMQDSSVSTEHRIVDFHSLHTVPRAFLDTLLIERGTPRLRLKPPYREHLSQSFARYFMRVGLPSPVTNSLFFFFLSFSLCSPLCSLSPHAHLPSSIVDSGSHMLSSLSAGTARRAVVGGARPTCAARTHCALPRPHHRARTALLRTNSRVSLHYQLSTRIFTPTPLHLSQQPTHTHHYPPTPTPPPPPYPSSPTHTTLLAW